MEKTEKTEDTEDVEDVEDMEDMEYTGHMEDREQKGTSINSVVLCCNGTMDIVILQ